MFNKNLKEKIQEKLMNSKPVKCYICKKDITLEDIDKMNFIYVKHKGNAEHYYHFKCI